MPHSYSDRFSQLYVEGGVVSGCAVGIVGSVRKFDIGMNKRIIIKA
jgi:hypothetical protein